MKPLDLTKPVQTRDGRKVRIYATDGVEPFPVHGAIYRKNIHAWTASVWPLSGALGIYETPSDLVNVPPKFRHEMWVNVYPNVVGASHHTRKQADEWASVAGPRIACLKVVIEGVEGDGL